MGNRGTAVAVLAAALALSATSATADPPPRIPSTELLPPIAPDEPAPDAAPVCGEDGLVCIRHVEQQLAEWEQHFGCDHRAVFPTVYRLLTRQTRLVLEDDPGVFDDPAGLGLEALRFYELYEQMITDHLAGREIPKAWQVAMEAANSGDWTAGHDMLLAINAHVQRDMPFAVADVGLVLPDGSSRKPDHDRFNQVLNAAYPTIVQEVGRRYDPLMTDVEALPVVDDVGANQVVAGWREGVWRNAESLVTTAGTPARPTSEATIEANAHGWADAMRTGEVPGHREVRDAHCRAALAAQEDEPGASDERRRDVDRDPRSRPPRDDDPGAGRPDTGRSPFRGADVVAAGTATSTAAEPLPSTGGGAATGLVAALAGWSLRRRHTRPAP